MNEVDGAWYPVYQHLWLSPNSEVPEHLMQNLVRALHPEVCRWMLQTRSQQLEWSVHGFPAVQSHIHDITVQLLAEYPPGIRIQVQENRHLNGQWVDANSGSAKNLCRHWSPIIQQDPGYRDREAPVFAKDRLHKWSTEFTIGHISTNLPHNKAAYSISLLIAYLACQGYPVHPSDTDMTFITEPLLEPRRQLRPFRVPPQTQDVLPIPVSTSSDLGTQLYLTQNEVLLEAVDNIICYTYHIPSFNEVMLEIRAYFNLATSQCNVFGLVNSDDPLFDETNDLLVHIRDTGYRYLNTVRDAQPHIWPGDNIVEIPSTSYRFVNGISIKWSTDRNPWLDMCDVTAYLLVVLRSQGYNLRSAYEPPIHNNQTHGL